MPPAASGRASGIHLIQLSHLVVLVLIYEIVELLVQHTPLLPSAGRANITQQSQSQPNQPKPATRPQQR